MGEILYYIFIFPVEQMLNWVLLKLFKEVIKNYGVAIILLSLVVNLFLLKIYLYTDRKAQKEAALKQKLDSRIQSWKKIHKKAKLYAFTKTLYRQHNYHPIFALSGLGGLALQIPFFIAMIHLVENADFLQGVSFLWIADLSKPDSISLFGIQVHLLPFLMTFFTLINVFYSSKDFLARIQGSLIALLFLVLLYAMPSALVLYWTCNMLFSLIKACIKTTKSTTEITETIHIKAIGSTQQQNYKVIQYGIINLMFLICLYHPYTLYATDLNSFSLNTIPLTLAALFGFFLFISLSLLYIVSILYNNNLGCKGTLYILAYIATFFTLLTLSYTFLLAGDYGVMSYFVFEKEVSASPNHELIDGITITCCAIFGLIAFIWTKRALLYMQKILFIALCIGTIIPLYTTLTHILERKEVTNLIVKQVSKNTQNSLLDFAKEHTNILVLILDRSDGYVVHEIFKESKNLQNSFQGFIDFTSALSSGGPTLPTLTSIIAGEYYTARNINQRNITDGLPNEIARGYSGVFNAFNKEGYAVSAIVDSPTDDVHLYPLLHNPQEIYFDTQHLQNIFIRKYLAGADSKHIPLTQLLSYGIFRISTFVIRKSVYRDGMWLFNKRGIKNTQGRGAIKPIAELNAFVEEITTNATKPTFKFIHSNITHMPYGFNEACGIDPNNIASPKDSLYSLPTGHYNSEKCAWQWVTQILERLQELGVYDNTEIFITSDHGAQGKFLPADYSLHIPLFYKPLHAKGAMKKDSRIITNYDIPALFCTHITSCPNIKPMTLKDIPTHRKVTSIQMVGGWNIESQNKNSFKIGKTFIFQGSDIYNKESWQVIPPEK